MSLTLPFHSPFVSASVLLEKFSISNPREERGQIGEDGSQAFAVDTIPLSPLDV